METFTHRGRNPYLYLLPVSFLSTGISAFLTFPRSMRLFDIGVGVAIYGVLLSLSSLVSLVMNAFIGRLVDRYGCLSAVLKALLAVSIVSHFFYIFSDDMVLLSILLVLETAASKVFVVFISQVISGIAPASYGRGLGYYKLAGSVAWAICASVSGYVTSYFGFSSLMTVVFVMAVAKMVLLTRLLLIYDSRTKDTRTRHTCDVPVRDILSVSMVNALVLYMIMQLQSNGGFSYLQIYLSTVLGLDEIESGHILAASGIFEILIAALVGRICDVGRNGMKTMVVVGSVLSAIRWLVLGNVYIGFAGLLFTQFLHGVMICTINIAFIDYFRALTRDEGFGTAIGLAGALSSLCTMAGSWLFGLVGDEFGLSSAYRWLGLLGLISVAAFLVVDVIVRPAPSRCRMTHAFAFESANKRKFEKEDSK